MIKKHSIRSKLIASFLLMILLTVSLFTAYSYVSGSRIIRNEVFKRGIDVTKVFSQMATHHYFSMDYIAILNSARDLVDNSDIVSIMLMDKNGNTIVDTDGVSSSVVEIDDFYRQILNKDKMEYRESIIGGDTILEFNSPVSIFDRVEAIVIVRISLKRMHRTLAKHTLNLVFIAIGLMALAIILAIILSKLFKPISVLIDGTNEIINGNLDFEMPELYNNEIGELTSSFDLMRQHLKSGFLKLEKRNETIRLLNEGLEQRVEKRTAQLSKSNTQLLQEISEREVAEDKLRRLRNSLENIIDSMPSMLAGLDDEGRVTQWNREAEKITGIDFTKAEGRLLNDLFPQLPVTPDSIKETVRQMNVKKLTMVEINIKDTLHYFDVTLYPLDEESIGGLVVRIDDVTEKKRVEEMMAHSEKMLSVGGLAIGMAHEINNPLAGILQNIQVLRNRLKENLSANQRVANAIGISIEDVEAYIAERGVFKTIEAIQVSGGRIARIVDNISYFSREYCPEKRKENIISLIDKAFESVADEYDSKNQYNFSGIEIIREYDEEVIEVACEPSLIEQVVISVVRNGVQAMAAEKDDRNVVKVSRFIIRVLREEDMCRIEIEDNGPGMDESIYKRIFEPFFATKAVDVGPGLGLSMSYFIVTESHGGTLNVETLPGKGANFVIRLPYDIK